MVYARTKAEMRSNEEQIETLLSCFSQEIYPRNLTLFSSRYAKIPKSAKVNMNLNHNKYEIFMLT